MLELTISVDQKWLTLNKVSVGNMKNTNGYEELMK